MKESFNYANFSLNMRLRAAEYRLNVTAAAKEIGISKPTLSRINREIGMPDIYTYFLCCKWMDKEMTSFFKSDK